MRGLVWAVMIFCACVLVIIQIRGKAPESLPYVRAVLPDTDCEPICWNGIQPGITDYKSARNTIAALPNTLPIEDALDTWGLSPDDHHWHMLTLNNKTTEVMLLPENVRLGEVLLSLGSPDFYTLRYVIEAREVQYRLIEIFYVDKQLRLTANITDRGRLSPQAPLLSLRYMPEVPTRSFDSRDWHGFAQNLLAMRS